MRAYSHPLLKGLILLAVLLALVAGLLFTPLGGWVVGGIGLAWRAFMGLPGIAWAREQMQTTPAVQETPGGAASAGSNSVRDLLESGFKLQEEGKLEDALSQYRDALKLDEGYAPTHAALASVYMQLGREDEALRELERAAELAPDNAYILRQLGALYLKRDEYEKSVAALERAKAAEPDEARTRAMLGTAYYYRSQADVEKAVSELEKSVELAPQDADARFRLAMAYVRRDDSGDREKAIQSLEKVLDLDPSQSEVYYYLGLLHMRGGEQEAAIAAWRRYVSVGKDQEAVEKVRSWLRGLEETQGATPEPTR